MTKHQTADDTMRPERHSDTALTDLRTDVQRLHDEVCQLQNTDGNVTEEDQMLIDAVQGKVENILEKLGSIVP